MNVTYDRRSFIIDGKPELLLSGALHYPRTTPDTWPEIIRLSKEAGLNTIETYVFWNLHERTRGEYDFSGRLNLPAFLKCIQDAGMHAVLRIGPYVCAETNYGGFPAWLRDIPGIRFRTWNRPFMDEVEKWVCHLSNTIRPFTADNGGPIILVQFENEYDSVLRFHGEEGQRYFEWSVELNRFLGNTLPLLVCGGETPHSITTINSFLPHTAIKKHAETWPDRPLVCTEFYTGWYSVFGYRHRGRTVENTAYAAARFFAEGGTGLNYYMWYAGTNFGRDGMYLQPPSYGFDAPINEYGKPGPGYKHLGNLHHVIAANAEILLAGLPERANTGEGGCVFTCSKGDDELVFLCSDNTDKDIRLKWAGTICTLAPQSVLIFRNNELLFDSSAAPAESKTVFTPVQSAVLTNFRVMKEPFPADRSQEAVKSENVIEQLSITRDRTDYCWYSTNLEIPEMNAGRGTLRFEGVGDIVSVFVDEELQARTEGPLQENKFLFPEEADLETMNDYACIYPSDFSQKFELELKEGTHRLDILCSALGLIKIEFMLGGVNMAEERKGLWGGVTWNGSPIHNWRLVPGLEGETLAVPTDDWETVPASKTILQGPVWIKTEFILPETEGDMVLDLAFMGKGMIFLNGIMVGRYWTIPGTNKDSVLEGWGLPIVLSDGTQRYYRLPAQWLKEKNTLILFEEFEGDPSEVRLCRPE